MVNNKWRASAEKNIVSHYAALIKGVLRGEKKPARGLVAYLKELVARTGAGILAAPDGQPEAAVPHASPYGLTASCLNP
jgi:hypothetical protein